MRIDGHTEVYGLIGKPVGHTVSPALHDAFARVCGRSLVYVPFQVDGDLGAAVKGAYELNIRGLNVTVPYKSRVIPFLSDIDEEAHLLGAVNTLVRIPGGYKGYNTDLAGLKKAVHADGIKLSGRPVMIIGAGGAARAASFAAAKESPSVLIIVNRTPAKARLLAEEVRKAFPGLKTAEGSLEDAGGLISGSGGHAAVFQCTSAGLYPETGECPVSDPEVFRGTEYGFDLIYNPEETLFMKRVRQSGGTARNGLAMLLYQGAASFELWTGEKIGDEALEEAMRTLSRAVQA